METVGVRDLKANLSRHLKRVRAGARLIVTERGRAVAAISPVDPVVDLDWAHRLVSDGRARWGGGKPAGAPKPPVVTSSQAVADAVLEDRG